MHFLDECVNIKNNTEWEFSIHSIEKIGDNYLFSITQKSYQFNEELENSKVYSLSQKCMIGIYPIKILINKNGQFVKLSDFKSFKKKWENHKKLLLEEYTDEFGVQYIQKMNHTINNEVEVNNMLKNNFLLNIFFFPIYNNFYNELYISNQEVRIPIIDGDSGVLFEIENSIKLVDDEGESYKINQSGKCIDKRLYNQILSKSEFALNNNSAPIDGRVLGEYTLNRVTKLIESIHSEYYLFLPEGKQVTTIIIKKVN